MGQHRIPETPSRTALGGGGGTALPRFLQEYTGRLPIRRPTLIVSAEDSPEAYRLVNARLSGALPFTRTVLVAGGHLINPAHPAALDFVDRIAAGPDTWT